MCDCGASGGALVTDNSCGDVVCTACGVVVEAHIFDERLEFTSEAAGARVGPSDWLLPTHPIVFSRQGGRDLSNHDPHASIRGFFKVIDSLSRGFSTDVVDAAKQMCRDLARVRVVKSGSRAEHAAAALYLSTKMRGAGAGRSRREMAVALGVCEERLTSLTKLFVQTLGPQCPPILQTSLEVDDLVNRAVDRLDDIEVAQRRALKKTCHTLVEGLCAPDLEGKTPRGVCGGVVFIAVTSLGLKIRKKCVASACMVSPTTIDKMVKLMA